MTEKVPTSGAVKAKGGVKIACITKPKTDAWFETPIIDKNDPDFKLTYGQLRRRNGSPKLPPYRPVAAELCNSIALTEVIKTELPNVEDNQSKKNWVVCPFCRHHPTRVDASSKKKRIIDFEMESTTFRKHIRRDHSQRSNRYYCGVGVKRTRKANMTTLSSDN